MESALAVLREEPSHDVAMLTAELARANYFVGKVDRAAELVEPALETAELLVARDVIAEALTTKWLILSSRRRHEEGFALLGHALRLSLEAEECVSALRTYNNIYIVASDDDRHEESLGCTDEGLSLARRLGERSYEWRFLGFRAGTFFLLGRWEELEATLAVLPSPEEIPPGLANELDAAYLVSTFLLCARGRPGEAERYLHALEAEGAGADAQERMLSHCVRARVALARGAYAEARAAAHQELDAGSIFTLRNWPVHEMYVSAIESSLALGDLDDAETVVRKIETAPPADVSRRVRGQALRLRALVDAARGSVHGVDEAFAGAEAVFREIGTRFRLAVTLLDHAEWLLQRGRMDEARPLLDDARAIAEPLGARPVLDRIEHAERVARETRATGVIA